MSYEFQRVPVATYRLQLNAGFDFERAREVVDYLARLGVSDLYLSPILQARSGSVHGYDVCDPTRISDDLGGEEGFSRLVAAASRHEMGILLDIVPNHMAASPENAWWMATLADGENSQHAEIFDINWRPAREGLHGRVLLPILGEPYADELRAGELRLEGSGHDAEVRYYEWRLPLHVPDDLSGTVERYQQAVSGGDTEQAADHLDALLSAQNYQLAYWRVAAEEINYRRFFDISDLVALRAEDRAVFEATHRKIFDLIGRGLVDGLRIDHIDGLRRPEEYLERLQEESNGGTYVLVEKILTGAEPLREGWQVAGTTGYDFLNIVNGVLADGQGAEALDAVFQRLTGTAQSFHDLVKQEKLLVIEQLFAGDLRELTRRFLRVADRDAQGRDLSGVEIRDGLSALTAFLPIYRTYIHDSTVHEYDREIVERSVSSAVEERPELERALSFLRRVLLFENQPDPDGDVYALQVEAIERWQQFSGPVMAKGLEDTSLYVDTRLVSLNAVGGDPDAIAVSVDDLHAWARDRAERWPLSMNATSTHDAKRSEDVSARINVLSEMPDRWEALLSQWRSWNAPLKPFVEGEPVPGPRAELLLYQTLLGAWPLDSDERDGFTERIQQYMLKAAREAKQSTSWVEQHPDYENALFDFVAAVLDPGRSERFLDDLESTVQIIAFHGALNSLTQVLLKATIPGIPDTYRGTELWDFSLVDPDNRRPVDFDRRRALLDEVSGFDAARSASLFERWQDGAVKLWFLQQVLMLRREHRAVFEQGSYAALEVGGARARHVIAFAREYQGQRVLVVLPRLTLRLLVDAELDSPALPIGDAAWDDTWCELPDGGAHRYRNVLDGEWHDRSRGEALLSRLFGRIPYAILVGE